MKLKGMILLFVFILMKILLGKRNTAMEEADRLNATFCYAIVSVQTSCDTVEIKNRLVKYPRETSTCGCFQKCPIGKTLQNNSL